MSRPRLNSSSSIRRHLPFLVIVPLLIIIMTWPTIAYVFDTETVWLLDASKDIFFKVWDIWYGRLVFAGHADPLFTDLQFFPQGMSLVYHQFAVPHLIAVGLLNAVMPVTNAYNLAHLLTLFLNASSTYLLLLYIHKDKRICLFGAALVGLSPYFAALELPDLTLIPTLPLAVYFFHRAIIERRLALSVLSGLAAGVTVFVGMYIFVCIALTLGIYGLFFALSRWKQRSFWLSVVILLGVLGSVSMIRIGPMIADRELFDEALDKERDFRANYDLLEFFVLTPNPILGAFLEQAFDIPPGSRLEGAYLGYIPLSLIVIGVASRTRRRQILPWLALLFAFALLGLGESLTINAVLHPDVLLPKHYLDRLFPELFRPFWNAQTFQIGVVLPLAVLSCYGLRALMDRVRPRRAGWLALALLALMAVEYYVPVNGIIIAKDQTKFVKWLRTEDPDSIRLIHLPMGRRESKYYAYLQSLSGYPHAEGAANRTPAKSYAYIDANPILRAWRRGNGISNCLPLSAKAHQDALQKLRSDGFTHVVVHRQLYSDRQAPFSVWHAAPVYTDDFVFVYRLDDLRGACLHPAFISGDVFAELFAIMPGDAIKIGDSASAVLIHPAGDAQGDMKRFYSLVQQSSPRVTPLTLTGVAANSPDPGQSHNERTRDLSQYDIVLLVYDRHAAEPDLINAYTRWIAGSFKSCGPLSGAGAARFEYFAKGDIPCSLLTAESPFAVAYEIDAALSNFLLQFDGELLQLYLLWDQLPDEAHGVSLQIFDEAGTNVMGQDSVLHNKAVIDLRLDLSRLAAGDYAAKLILYNYETGISVPGAVSSADTPFDRELELGRLTID